MEFLSLVKILSVRSVGKTVVYLAGYEYTTFISIVTMIPSLQANLERYCKALNRRKISTEEQHTPCQMESMFLHLKEEYEGRLIQDSAERDAEFAYHDPANIDRPLPHVKCEIRESLPKKLLRELRLITKPKTIHQGKVAFLKSIQVVADYVNEHGPFL